MKNRGKKKKMPMEKAIKYFETGQFSRVCRERANKHLFNFGLTCIPSQIICDSDPKILDSFDIFEDRPLYIWSMDLFDLFPCYLHHIAFDWLKSHTQFPCPAYLYKFQCVFCILNFSIANTVIRKESYFRINVCWDDTGLNKRIRQEITKICRTKIINLGVKWLRAKIEGKWLGRKMVWG